MLLALTNGIGSGIMMTLGADLADRTNPAPFLGAWRFTGGLGGAGAPLLIAGLTAVASIAIAAGALIVNEAGGRVGDFAGAEQLREAKLLSESPA